MIDEARVGHDPAHRVWFAEKKTPKGDPDTVGCVALIDRGDGRGQLRWLIVLPDARGLGVGVSLMDAVLDRAQALGLQQVFLLTAPGLPESMGLYHRYGFVITREAGVLQWHGDGHDIEMTLALDTRR